MDNDAFSSIDFVAQCLFDKERTEVLGEKIEDVVTDSSNVFEAGTGSAILSLFAARAGARKVTAVEFDPYIASVARKNIENNGYENVITVIEADARTAQIEEEPFDIVIMEMLTAGMVDEFQVQAINNLIEQGLITEKTTVVPEKQETFIAPIQADFSISGFETKMVVHNWSIMPNKVSFDSLAPETLLNSINFKKEIDDSINQTLNFTIKKDGTLNAIYLTSQSIFSDGSALGDTAALNGPVIIPLESEFVVTSGQNIQIRVIYRFGHGYKNFSASVV